MYFEHEITATIDRNDEDFYIQVTLVEDDQSFTHEFGVRQLVSWEVAEIEVYQNDVKVTDENLIAQVQAHYEKYYLEDDVA